MTLRSFNWYTDFALGNLGYDQAEAEEYARRRLEQDAHEAAKDHAQLGLVVEPKPPGEQVGPAEEWPEGFM